MKKIIIIVLFIPLFSQAQFTALSNVGSGSSKFAGQTTLFITNSNTNTNIPSNTFYVIVVTFDNLTGTDGDNGEVLSISSAVNTSDMLFTKAKEFTNGNGSSLAGSTTSIWYGVTTATITGGFNITITFNGAPTSATAVIKYFSKGASTSIGVSTTTGTLANDNADAGSITLSSLTSQEYLFIRSCAVENNTSTGTASTNFTNLIAAFGTTGGSAVTNMWNQSEYRITTTTSQASDPTTGSADIASAMVAFYEFTSSPPATPSDKRHTLLGVGGN